MKAEEATVLIIITIGAVFLILSFIDDRNYTHSGPEEYDESRAEEYDELWEKRYDECTPDQVWGGCL